MRLRGTGRKILAPKNHETGGGRETLTGVSDCMLILILQIVKIFTAAFGWGAQDAF